MKKAIVIVLVLACLGLVGWRIVQKVAQKRALENRQNRERSLAVAVEPVRTETIRDVAEFTGTLLPRSRFVIAPKVPGRLEKLLVNIGDTVTRGDLIAVLDSEEYAQHVAHAQAELDVSRANLGDYHSALEVATHQFDRTKELVKQRVASEAELDEAEARYRAAQAKYAVAEAQIRQKEAALKTVQVRLSYTRIPAAWEEGDPERVIAERFVDQGAMLKANDPIVSVVESDSVIAVIYVIERDYPDIRVGQSATVTTDAYPDRSFSGTIMRRAPVLKEESRQARVEIEIPNPEGLLAPGMFVRVRIQFAEHENARVIPVGALVRRNGRQGVFLVDKQDEMKARFVPVRLGIIEDDSAELLEPPLSGIIVTMGQHLLEDGASVTLPEAKSVADGAPTGEVEGSRP